MNIIIDTPITSSEGDILSRRNFAKNIAQNLNTINCLESFTFGLIGEWGSGKSSVINMIKENIDLKKFDIVDFNPWIFSGRQNIIADFFNVLSEEIGYEGKVGKQLLSGLGKSLKLMSIATTPLLFTPLGILYKDGIQETKKDLNEMASAIGNYSDKKESNLMLLKKEINDKLTKRNKKVLIVIDEIDRLDEKEIDEVFYLVKALGDFNNIVYLLSYDNNIVENVYKDNKQYLDKIVNVQVNIPIIKDEQINEYFLNKLTEILKDTDMNKEDEKYWDEVYKKFFRNNFKHLREVNKFLNIIILNRDFMLRELSPIDFILITHIKMEYPLIYAFIWSNKDKLLAKKIELSTEDYNLLNGGALPFKKLVEKLIFNKAKNRNPRSINNPKYFSMYFHEYLDETVIDFTNMRKIINVKSISEIRLLEIYRNSFALIVDNIEEISNRLPNEIRILYFLSILEDISAYDKSKENAWSESDHVKMLKNLVKLISYNFQSLDARLVISTIENLPIDRYAFEELVNLYLKLYKNFNDDSLNAVIRTVIEEHLYKTEYNYEIRNSFRIIKDFGIDIKTYLNELISEKAGLEQYLESYAFVAEVFTAYDYDDRGEIVDSYPVEVEDMIRENVSEYIGYDVIEEKIEGIQFEYRSERLNELITLFRKADSYENLRNKYNWYEQGE